MSEESALFQTLMNQGHTAAWDQDWEEAAEKYRQALAEIPDHISALASLGLANFQLKKYDDAMRSYQRCSALSPEDPMPYEKMARIQERTGLLTNAVKTYLQAGEVQLKARNAERAIDNFREAIRLNPKDQTAHTRLAMIYDRLGDKAESINEYLYTAGIMQSLGDQKKAEQVLQYVLQQSPESQEAKAALAKIVTGQQLPLPESQKGSNAPARMAQVVQLEDTQAPVESTPNYDPLTEARLTALKQMAGLLFENEEAPPPETQGGRRSLLSIARGTGMLTAEHAERTRIQLHISQTIDLQTAGQDDQAAVELERAIDLGLNQSASYYVLGLLIRAHSPQKALKYLQRSVKNPSYALASYLLIAEIYERSEQFKEASLNYLQALKLADLETVPPALSEELAQLYEPIFESQLRVDEEKDLRNLCTVISGQLLRTDWRQFLIEARNQLPPQNEGNPPLPLAEMLLETSSSQVVEALALIRQLAAEGKTRTAMEEAFSALTYAPTYLPLHIQMGEMLINEGRITEAVEKFQVVCNLYHLRGETAQAIRLLGRVTKLAPMDLSIRSSLIDLLKSIGRVDDAIQQYMDLANVYYLLAEMDVTRQTYLSALALTQKSSSVREWSLKILNKLADIELQSLDWKQAIKYFEQIRSLDGFDPNPRAMLVDLYFRIGVPTAALNELDAYLRFLSTSEQPSKAASFLEGLLVERPENVEIQKRLVTYYRDKDQLPLAIEKLDALAEKTLGAEDIPGTMATLEHIISLQPPNTGDYQKLFMELKAKSGG
jgi:tetratricopeptide (TPR) repeat protein